MSSEVSNPSARLLSSRDVAALLGISVAGVSNLRSRRSDFPTPIETETGFRYDEAEIREWAKRDGRKLLETPVTIELSPEQKFQQVALAAALASLNDLVAASIITLPIDQALSSVMELVTKKSPPELVHTSGILGALQLALHSLAGGSDSAEVTESALLEVLRDTRPRAHGGAGKSRWRRRVEEYADQQSLTELGRQSVYSTPADLAEWIVAASGPWHGSVCDPACGGGGILVAGAKYRGVRRDGFDITAEPLALAALRFLSLGIKGRFAEMDTLKFGLFSTGNGTYDMLHAYDTVVVDPPTGPCPEEYRSVPTFFGRPPTDDQTFLWFETALALLKDDGCAVAVSPLRTLETPGRALAIREEMLMQGAVTAIITLPGKMHRGPSTVRALWVLQQPREAKPVLLIDGSVLDGPEQLGPILRDFRSAQDGYRPVRGTVVVPIHRLKDAARNLVPWANAGQEPLLDSISARMEEPLGDALSIVHADFSPPVLAFDDTLDDSAQAIRQARASLEAAEQALQEMHTIGSIRVRPLMDYVESGDVMVMTPMSLDAGSRVEPVKEFLKFAFASAKTTSINYDLLPSDVVVSSEQGDLIATIAGASAELPSSTIAVLRSSDDTDSSELLTATINATRWDSSTRGRISLKRLLTFVMVPDIRESAPRMQELVIESLRAPHVLRETADALQRAINDLLY